MPLARQVAFQIAIFALAQQTRTNGGNRDQGRIHFDECLIGRARFGAPNRLAVAAAFECRVDLADAELQATYGPVPDQSNPVLHFANCGIEYGLGTRGDIIGRQAAQAEPPRHFYRGTHDAVVHDHDGDRCAADYVDVVALLLLHQLHDVEPDVVIEHFCDTGFRYAYQHDRFVVFHELGSGEHTILIDADEDVDRPAGIADGGHKVRVQEDPTKLFIVVAGHRDRWIAGRCVELRGTRHYLVGLHIRQILWQRPVHRIAGSKHQ